MDPGAELSPKGVALLASVKYGCESASAAEMRSAGSNLSNRSRRSRAAGDAFGRTCAKLILGYRGNGFS